MDIQSDLDFQGFNLLVSVGPRDIPVMMGFVRHRGPGRCPLSVIDSFQRIWVFTKWLPLINVDLDCKLH